jgi:hypothetical protein
MGGWLLPVAFVNSTSMARMNYIVRSSSTVTYFRNIASPVDATLLGFQKVPKAKKLDRSCAAA